MTTTEATPEARINFSQCLRSPECDNLWILLVDEYEKYDEYMVRATVNSTHTFIYFSSKTLPDYLKDSISIIRTWYRDNRQRYTDYERKDLYGSTRGINQRPPLVPEEFKTIGWMYSSVIDAENTYAVAMTWEQLQDLYSRGPVPAYVLPR